NITTLNVPVPVSRRPTPRLRAERACRAGRIEPPSHAPDPSGARGLLAAGSCGPRGRVAKLAGVSESICAGESHRSKAGAHLRAGQPAAEPQGAPGTAGDGEIGRAHD